MHNICFSSTRSLHTFNLKNIFVQINKRFGFIVLQVAQYLLDRSYVLDEESMYEASLRIEPKVPN